MAITEGDGITQVANAAYGIVYMQPSLSDQPDGTDIPLNVLASGNADIHGVFTATLDTSSINPADLGDALGGGNYVDAFNADVVLQDATGAQVVVPEIMRIGQANSDTATVNLTPSSSPGAAWNAGTLPTDVPVLAHDYRFEPATPLNDGDGMKAQLHYTFTTSVAKQTDTSTAIVGPDGGISIGNQQLEEKDRSTDGFLYEDHGFHAWVWVRYKWLEYAYRLNKKWLANHWTGDMEVKNPDPGGARSTYNPIGIVSYNVPNFTPGPGGAYWFALTANNTGWGRTSGTRSSNTADLNFYLPFAGNLDNVSSTTTYGSITAVHYFYEANGACGSGTTRVIWGFNNDPASAQRLQANCFSNSML